MRRLHLGRCWSSRCRRRRVRATWTRRARPWFERIRYPLRYARVVRVHAREPTASIRPCSPPSSTRSRSSGSDARSSSGAIGLMQITPATAGGSRSAPAGRAFTIERPHDPEINIRYGAWYLQDLFEKYGSEQLVLAAYNAGQGNVDRWRANGEAIQFPETRAYVERVEHLKTIYGGPGGRPSATDERRQADRARRERRPTPPGSTSSRRPQQNARVRVSAKADYAIRATVELAAAGEGPVKGDRIAKAQEIPIELPREHPVRPPQRRDRARAARGAEGGYWLARPAAEVEPRGHHPGRRRPACERARRPLGAGRLSGERRTAARRVGRGPCVACAACWRTSRWRISRAASCRRASVPWPQTPTPGRRTETWWGI